MPNNGAGPHLHSQAECAREVALAIFEFEATVAARDQLHVKGKRSQIEPASFSSNRQPGPTTNGNGLKLRDRLRIRHDNCRVPGFVADQSAKYIGAVARCPAPDIIRGLDQQYWSVLDRKDLFESTVEILAILQTLVSHRPSEVHKFAKCRVGANRIAFDD